MYSLQHIPVYICIRIQIDLLCLKHMNENVNLLWYLWTIDTKRDIDCGRCCFYLLENAMNSLFTTNVLIECMFKGGLKAQYCCVCMIKNTQNVRPPRKRCSQKIESLYFQNWVRGITISRNMIKSICCTVCEYVIHCTLNMEHYAVKWF